jgi:hypothetical protein
MAELIRHKEAARNSVEWQPGIPAVQAEAKALLEAVKKKCDQIGSAGHVDLDCEMDARQLPRGLGLDFGMPVAAADADFGVVLGEILRNALREGGA